MTRHPWLALMLWLFLALPSVAQEFRISAGGCIRPGGTVAVSGSFTGRTGEILLLEDNRAIVLAVRGWSSTRVRLALPEGVTPGPKALVWRVVPEARPGDRTWIPLGTLRLCRDAGRPGRILGDVVTIAGQPEFIVSVAPREVALAVQALQGAGATLLRQTDLPNLGRVLLVVTLPADLSQAEARDILQRAAPSARIDRHHVYGLAQDPRLYAAGLIGDDPARRCLLARPVAIGMIDGPLNPDHPALAGVELVTTSVLDPAERPVTRDHGTAVAGLLAGRSATFPGFAPGARVYAVTAFSAQGGGAGRLEAVALGLDWLAGQGVRIVNLSMEGSPNAAFEDILARAAAAGLVMVAAAGNEGTEVPRYPAASPHTIAVTAVDAAGRPYAQANTGDHIDLAAPGVDLFVPRGAGGAYRSGTSYAAPIVAALIARLADRRAITRDSALQSLRDGARDLGPAGRDAQFGFGLVQTGGC